jgi:hypothetical protein
VTKIHCADECIISFPRTSLPIDRHQPVLHKFKGKFTLSHSHGCELTNRGIESWQAVQRSPPRTHLIPLDPGLQVHLPNCLITASTSASPNVINHHLQVYLQTGLNTAYKFAHSWPTSVSPTSFDYGLHKCISKFAGSRPPSVSPNSLDHGLQVYLETSSITTCKFPWSWSPRAYLQTRSVTANKCISKLTSLWPPHLHLITTSQCISKYAVLPPSTALQSRWITALKCISEITRSLVSGAPWNPLKHKLQSVQIWHE